MSPSSYSARDQALYLLTRRHSGEFSAEDQGAFQRWLAEDEENWREFSRARRLWQDLGAFREQDFPEWRAARAHRAKRRDVAASRWARAWSLTFSLMTLCLLGTSAWWSHTATETYATARGEYRLIKLADGSEVTLNTDSELSVVWLHDRRLLHLRRGEAFFHVAHDTGRPFEVYAGPARVRDIGTRFAIARKGDETRVLVEEGIVSVDTGLEAPRRLIHDQGLRIFAAGPLRALEPLRVADELAWREGKIILKSRPLADVLVEIRRYHDIDIRLAEPQLGQSRISGVFGIRELQPLLASLEAALDLQAESISPGQIMLRRAGARIP